MVQLLCKLCLQSVPFLTWKTHITQKEHIQQLPIKITVKGHFQDETDDVYEYFGNFGGIRGYNATQEGDLTVIELRFWDARIYSEVIHMEHTINVEISWWKKVKSGLQCVEQDERMQREKFTYQMLAIIDKTKVSPTFAEQLMVLLDKLRPFREDMENIRKMISTELTTALAPLFPHSKLHFFGSSITNLDLFNSDVNIYIDGTDATETALAQIKDVITNSDRFQNLSLVTKNGAPTLQCLHKTRQTRCALIVQNELPVGTSELIKFYISLNEKLRDLMLVVKFWADCHDLGLSGYALNLLVVFYLQQEPYNLPTVCDLQRDLPPDEIAGWNCAFGPVEFEDSFLENCTVLEMLTGFFQFYGKFDFTSKVVSVFSGRSLDKTDFIKPYNLDTCFQDLNNDREFVVTAGVCVQDPFQHTNNVTCSVPLVVVGKFPSACRVSAELALLPQQTELLYKLALSPESNCFSLKIEHDLSMVILKRIILKILTDICSCEVTEATSSDGETVFYCKSGCNFWDTRPEAAKKVAQDVSVDHDAAITRFIKSSVYSTMHWSMQVCLKFQKNSRMSLEFSTTENFALLSYVQHFIYIKLMGALSDKTVLAEDIKQEIIEEPPSTKKHDINASEKIEVVEDQDHFISSSQIKMEHSLNADPLIIDLCDDSDESMDFKEELCESSSSMDVVVTGTSQVQSSFGEAGGDHVWPDFEALKYSIASGAKSIQTFEGQTEFFLHEFRLAVTRVEQIRRKVEMAFGPSLSERLFYDPISVGRILKIYIHEPTDIQSLLMQSEEFASVSVNDDVIKFVHISTNTSCEVVTKDYMDKRKTLLVQHYMGLNPKVETLMSFLHFWATCLHVEALPIDLLVIFFLQQEPYKLPCVRDLEEETPHLSVDDDICTLINNFFKFYLEFDYFSHAISIYLGTAIEMEGISMSLQHPFHHSSNITVSWGLLRNFVTLCKNNLRLVSTSQEQLLYHMVLHTHAREDNWDFVIFKEEEEDELDWITAIKSRSYTIFSQVFGCEVMEKTDSTHKCKYLVSGTTAVFFNRVSAMKTHNGEAVTENISGTHQWWITIHMVFLSDPGRVVVTFKREDNENSLNVDYYLSMSLKKFLAEKEVAVEVIGGEESVVEIVESQTYSDKGIFEQIPDAVPIPEKIEILADTLLAGSTKSTLSNDLRSLLAKSDISIATSELNFPNSWCDFYVNSDTINRVSELVTLTKETLSRSEQFEVVSFGEFSLLCRHVATLAFGLLIFSECRPDNALIAHYLALDPKVVRLMTVVKFWVRRCKLVDFSGYCLYLMVIFYLQNEADKTRKPWNSMLDVSEFAAVKNSSLFDLVRGFFAFYGSFDYLSYLVSPYLGPGVEKSRSEISGFCIHHTSGCSESSFFCASTDNSAKFSAMCRSFTHQNLSFVERPSYQTCVEVQNKDKSNNNFRRCVETYILYILKKVLNCQVKKIGTKFECNNGQVTLLFQDKCRVVVSGDLHVLHVIHVKLLEFLKKKVFSLDEKWFDSDCSPADLFRFHVISKVREATTFRDQVTTLINALQRDKFELECKFAQLHEHLSSALGPMWSIKIVRPVFWATPLLKRVDCRVNHLHLGKNIDKLPLLLQNSVHFTQVTNEHGALRCIHVDTKFFCIVKLSRCEPVLDYYLGLDEKVLQLVTLVQFWGWHFRLADSALCWMVVFYLQQEPYLLPAVEEIDKDGQNSGFADLQAANIFDLVEGFFKFYGDFDYFRYGVAPLSGCVHEKTGLVRLTSSSSLIIQNPFRRSRNLLENVPHTMLGKFFASCRNSQYLMTMGQTNLLYSMLTFDADVDPHVIVLNEGKIENEKWIQAVTETCLVLASLLGTTPTKSIKSDNQLSFSFPAHRHFKRSISGLLEWSSGTNEWEKDRLMMMYLLEGRGQCGVNVRLVFEKQPSRVTLFLTGSEFAHHYLHFFYTRLLRTVAKGQPRLSFTHQLALLIQRWEETEMTQRSICRELSAILSPKVQIHCYRTEETSLQLHIVGGESKLIVKSIRGSPKFRVTKERIVWYQDTPCDLHFTLPSAGLTSSIAYYIGTDDKVSLLTCAIKFWAQSFQAAFSNDALSLMVIFFLQVRYNLPSVACVRNGYLWHERAIATLQDVDLSDLLLGFFDFYDTFDYSLYVICPFFGSAVRKIHFLKPYSLPGVFGDYINQKKDLPVSSNVDIQNPFNLQQNLSQEVTPFELTRFSFHCHKAARMPVPAVLDSLHQDQATPKKIYYIIHNTGRLPCSEWVQLVKTTVPKVLIDVCGGEKCLTSRSKYAIYGKTDVWQDRTSVAKKLKFAEKLSDMKREAIVTTAVTAASSNVESWEMYVQLRFADDGNMAILTFFDEETIWKKISTHFVYRQIVKGVKEGGDGTQCKVSSASTGREKIDAVLETIRSTVRQGPVFRNQLSSLLHHLHVNTVQLRDVKKKLRDDLISILKFHIAVDVMSFGDTFSKLDILDVFIVGPSQNVLPTMYSLILQSTGFDQVNLTSQVVVCRHLETDCVCRVHVGTKFSWLDNQMMEKYMSLDNVNALALVVKFWADCQELTGDGKFSRDAIYMLVIFYLQQQPIKLPSVLEMREMVGRKVRSQNVDFILVSKFFEFYSNFDYFSYVVSPFLGFAVRKERFVEPYDLPEGLDQFKGLPVDSSICIQDFYDHSRNVAPVGARLSGRFTELCRRSLQILATTEQLLLILDKNQFDSCRLHVTQNSSFPVVGFKNIIRDIFHCSVDLNTAENLVTYCCTGTHDIWNNRVVAQKKLSVPPPSDLDVEIAVTARVVEKFPQTLPWSASIKIHLTSFGTEVEFSSQSELCAHFCHFVNVKILNHVCGGGHTIVPAGSLVTVTAKDVARNAFLKDLKDLMPKRNKQSRLKKRQQDNLINSAVSSVVQNKVFKLYRFLPTEQLYFRNSEYHVQMEGDRDCLEEIQKSECFAEKFAEVAVVPGEGLKCRHKETELTVIFSPNKLSAHRSLLLQVWINHFKMHTEFNMLKVWAERHKLSEHLSVEALCIMVIFFMQHVYKQPSVETLQKDIPEILVDGWNCACELTKRTRLIQPMDLIQGFFTFYGTFDFFSYVIAPYFGSPVEKIHFLQPFSLPNAYKTYMQVGLELPVDTVLCIQDPFEHSRNLTENVSYEEASRFACYCRRAAQIMKNSSESLLDKLLIWDDTERSQVMEFSLLRLEKYQNQHEWETFVYGHFEAFVQKILVGTAIRSRVGSTVEFVCHGPYDVLSGRTSALKTILPLKSNKFDEEIAITSKVDKIEHKWQFTALLVPTEYQVSVTMKGENVFKLCHFLYTRLIQPVTDIRRTPSWKRENEAGPSGAPENKKIRLDEPQNKNAAPPSIPCTSHTKSSMVAPVQLISKRSSPTPVLPPLQLVSSDDKAALIKLSKEEDSLDSQFSAILESFFVRKDALNARLKLIQQDLESILSQVSPQSEVHLYGSAVTGTFRTCNNVNVFLNKKLLNFGAVLGRENKFSSVEKLSSNVLQCTHIQSGFKCALQMEREIEWRNSQLMSYYLSLDPKLQPLLCLLKMWTDHGKLRIQPCYLTAHTLNLMVMFYIQQEPYRLPSVAQLQMAATQKVVDGWNVGFTPANWDSFGLKNARLLDLLFGFFEFYSKFDYYSYVIAPFAGTALDKTRFCRPLDLPNCYSFLKKSSKQLIVSSSICVQDPFEHDKNTAALMQVGSVEAFTRYCRSSALCKDLPPSTRLYHLFIHPSTGRVEMNGFLIPRGKFTDLNLWIEKTKKVVITILTKIFGCKVITEVVGKKICAIGPKPVSGNIVQLTLTSRMMRGFWNERISILKTCQRDLDANATRLDKDMAVSAYMMNGQATTEWPVDVSMAFFEEVGLLKVLVSSPKKLGIKNFLYTRMLMGLEEIGGEGDGCKKSIWAEQDKMDCSDVPRQISVATGQENVFGGTDNSKKIKVHVDVPETNTVLPVEKHKMDCVDLPGASTDESIFSTLTSVDPEAVQDQTPSDKGHCSKEIATILPVEENKMDCSDDPSQIPTDENVIEQEDDPSLTLRSEEDRSKSGATAETSTPVDTVSAFIGQEGLRGEESASGRLTHVTVSNTDSISQRVTPSSEENSSKGVTIKIETNTSSADAVVLNTPSASVGQDQGSTHSSEENKNVLPPASSVSSEKEDGEIDDGSDDDIPSDFFDDFANEDFLEGLGVVDSLTNSDTANDAFQRRRYSRSRKRRRSRSRRRRRRRCSTSRSSSRSRSRSRSFKRRSRRRSSSRDSNSFSRRLELFKEVRDKINRSLPSPCQAVLYNHQGLVTYSVPQPTSSILIHPSSFPVPPPISIPPPSVPTMTMTVSPPVVLQDPLKLFEEKKISLPEFLKISVENKALCNKIRAQKMQEKIKLISRCQEALSILNGTTVGKLIVLSSANSPFESKKYQSPLARAYNLRFEFTSPSEYSEPFSDYIGSLPRRVGVEITAHRVEEFSRKSSQI